MSRAQRPMPENRRSQAPAPSPAPTVTQQQPSPDQDRERLTRQWGQYVSNTVTPQIEQGAQLLESAVQSHPDSVEWLQIQQIYKDSVRDAHHLIASVQETITDPQGGGSAVDFDRMHERGQEAFSLIAQAPGSNEEKMQAARALRVFSSLRESQVRSVLGQ